MSSAADSARPGLRPSTRPTRPRIARRDKQGTAQGSASRPSLPKSSAMARDNLRIEPSGSRETSSAIVGDILEMVQYRLLRIGSTPTPSKVRAHDHTGHGHRRRALFRPRPARMGRQLATAPRWKAESALNLGELRLIDADGNSVKSVDRDVLLRICGKESGTLRRQRTAALTTRRLCPRCRCRTAGDRKAADTHSTRTS